MRVAVWGTGNMGRAGIRSVVAHPDLDLVAVIGRSLAGQDAGTVADLAPLGVTVSPDVPSDVDAVVYMASGDIRPDEAVSDITGCLRSGAVVVTPSVYALYDPTSAPESLTEPLREACKAGGSALFVSGIDPGWGNDILPVLLTGMATTITQVRCQEIFDYSTYDQPDAVRSSVGMGGSMEQVPIMVAPSIPTMIWGGQLRMMARALGFELEDIRETVERRALEHDVTNSMGLFEKGTQGGLRFEIQGVVGGEVKLVVEHITRIAPDVAPDWPAPADGGAGAHTIVIEGQPRIVVTVEAETEGGNRAAGGNATAAARLVNAIPWLRAAAPGLYDAMDVPLSPAVGKL